MSEGTRGRVSAATSVPPPDVSFIMAAHDAAPWIEAAVASALAQVGVTVEVVVVDDASRDDTAARVAAIDDPRVRLLRRPASGGPSAARNLALDHARGTWVAVLDADDLVLPDRSRALIALARDSGCAVAADNVVRFTDGERSAQWPLMPAGPDRVVGLAEYLRRNRMTGGDGNLGYLKPLVERAFLDAHAIRYDEDLRIGEDFNFCLRLLAAGTGLALTGRAFYRYRVSAGSLSRRLSRADLDAMLAVHAGALDRAALDPDARAAEAAYRRSVGDLLAYVELRADMRDRAWPGAVRGLMRPRTWAAVAAVAASAGSRRWRRARARRAAPAGSPPAAPPHGIGTDRARTTR